MADKSSDSESAKGLRPAHFVSWWKLWKTLPVASWVRAAENFKAGNYRLAAEFYEKGLAEKPTHPAVACAQLDRAYCLFQLHQVQAAMSALHEAVKHDSAPKDAYLFLARLQLITGHGLSAQRTIKLGLKYHRGDVQLLLCFAYCAIVGRNSLSHVLKIKEFLFSLRSRIPVVDTLNSSYETAVAAYELKYGDAEIGETILSRVLASGDAPFEAVLLRGEKWLEQGRIAQAREQLVRAMKLDANDARPVHLLAKSYLAEEIEYSRQFAELACSLSNWENPECIDVLAECYKRIGDHDTALLLVARVRALRAISELNLDTVLMTEESLSRISSSKYDAAR